MSKRKPKPATAGEKIASGVTHHRDHFTESPKLARTIDRAIARAVKKERFRCMAILANARDATPYTALPKVTISRVLCSIEEGETP